MRPLNIRFYLESGLRKVLPQIFLLAIKLMLFMFLMSIGFAINHTLKSNLTGVLEQKVSFAFHETLSNDQKNNHLEQIQSIFGFETIMKAGMQDGGACKMIMYNTFCWLWYVTPDAYDQFMVDQQAILVEGRLPEQADELVITMMLSKSLKAQVGDTVGQKELLQSNYKIVGIIEAPSNFYFMHYDALKLDGYVITGKEGNVDKFYHYLENHPEDFMILTQKEGILDFISSTMGLLVVFGIIILCITALEASVSISHLNKVYFNERAYEYALLKAIGYKESFIKKRALKEMMIFIMCGLLLGLIFGQTMMMIFKGVYTDPKGIPYRQFEIGIHIVAVAFVMILAITSFILTYRHIKRIENIDALQAAL